MKVAIIGSREFADLTRVAECVTKLPPDTIVVSGGARGVDTEAEVTARRIGLGVIVLRPNYAEFGKRAPLIRNVDIVKQCDRLVAFWDGASTGTMHAVSLARRLGKPVEMVTLIPGQ
jgi:hypothetical protein